MPILSFLVNLAECGVALQRRVSAASTPMQRLCAADKLLHWPGRLSSLRLHAVLVGDTDVKPAAALTWWSEDVRGLRVTD